MDLFQSSRRMGYKMVHGPNATSDLVMVSRVLFTFLHRIRRIMLNYNDIRPGVAVLVEGELALSTLRKLVFSAWSVSGRARCSLVLAC